MKLKQNALAAAVVAALALGASGQASADVYAGSRLEIKDFSLGFVPSGTATLGDVSVSNYTFTAKAGATLNGGGTSMTVDCSPTATPCPATAPILSAVYNAPGGAPTRAVGDFTFFGPGTGMTFANSGSQIYEAELASGNPTITTQISEAEIAGTGVALAGTSMSSETFLTFAFTVTGSVDMYISFMADPDIFLKVATPGHISNTGFADVTATLSLNGSGGQFITWAPTGTAASSFGACDGATCTELADNANLNTSRGLTSTNNTSSGYSDSRSISTDTGWQSFGISVVGLAAGNYNLVLASTTSARVSQLVVPEPGILALLGIGLAGLGLMSRRRAA